MTDCPTVAVTGAGGFLGINVVRALAAGGHSVIAIDRAFLARVRAPLAASGVILETTDVLDTAALVAVFARHRPVAVFHGATLTADVSRERRAFAEILAVNVVGTANVLEAARSAGVARVLVASSSAVYGEAVFAGSPAEADPARPVSLYGISKLAAEQAALRFGAIHDLDVVAVRIAAVFGAWEHRSGARDAMSPPFQLAERAVAGGTARLSESGARDWIDAGRVAAIIRQMLQRDRLDHRLYNIAAASTWSPQVVAVNLGETFPAFRFEVAGGAPDIDYRDDLTRRRQPLDTGRLTEELGAEALGDPDTDAAAFAAWVAANRDWFDNDGKEIAREG